MMLHAEPFMEILHTEKRKPQLWHSGILPKYWGESTGADVQLCDLRKRHKQGLYSPLTSCWLRKVITHPWVSAASTSEAGDTLTAWRQGPDTIGHFSRALTPRCSSIVINHIYCLSSETSFTIAAQLTSHSPNREHPKDSNVSSFQYKLNWAPCLSPKNTVEKAMKGTWAMGTQHFPSSWAPHLSPREPQAVAIPAKRKLQTWFLFCF